MNDSQGNFSMFDWQDSCVSLHQMLGPFFEFLVADHARLAGLLELVAPESGETDLSAYHSFRAELLKHIGMEEKILLPALERAHRVSAETAGRLRCAHQALVALLASTPSAGIVSTFRAVLADHDRLESGPGGLYETCEELDEETRAALLARVRSAPSLPVAPLRGGAQTIDAARRALARAGYDVDDHGSLRTNGGAPVKAR